MRITRIEMSDFRGIKGPKAFPLDLTRDGVAKNLLLYGENGSGKSTIALALDRVVRDRSHDVKADANRFRMPDSETGVFVQVTLSDGQHFTYGNSTDEPTPEVLRTLKDAQLRCGFLGYKVLLKTSFYSGLSQHTLFDLLVTEILADHPLVIDGSPQPIGASWRGIVRAKPRRHREYNVPEYQRRIGRFNEALSAAMSDIETSARQFLEYFTQQKIQLRLHYTGAKYDEGTRRLVEGAIAPHVEFGGETHTDFSEWLNEARLSCLALCLHLASVKKRDVAPSVGLDPLRVLCLDDVLIGLDMSNRRHVIQILNEHFADFQIFLTTYDRHWFEVAKKEVGDNWLRAEMYEGEDDAGDFKPILITPSLSDYGHAKAYFESKDYAACANYLRKVCEAEICRIVPEWRRRNATESGELYYVNTLQDLHSRLMDYLERNGIDSKPYRALDVIKAAILNPFSHADMGSPLYRGELLDAFAFIDQLGRIQRMLVANIQKRNHRDVPVSPYGTLSDYIPFYFTPYSIMLYNIKTGYGGVPRVPNEEVAILVSSLHQVVDMGGSFVFTNQHAYPAAAEYFKSLDDLHHVDWPLLQARDFRHDPEDPGKKERYQAEALVHRHLPVNGLLGIGCAAGQIKKQLQKEIEMRRIDLPVAVRQGWYF